MSSILASKAELSTVSQQSLHMNLSKQLRGCSSWHPLVVELGLDSVSVGLHMLCVNTSRRVHSKERFKVECVVTLGSDCTRQYPVGSFNVFHKPDNTKANLQCGYRCQPFSRANTVHGVCLGIILSFYFSSLMAILWSYPNTPWCLWQRMVLDGFGMTIFIELQSFRTCKKRYVLVF